MNNKTRNRVQHYKSSRNAEIFKQFRDMTGTITSRIAVIAEKHNMADITVRVILTKAGLIGSKSKQVEV